jgi:hypothetical protein
MKYIHITGKQRKKNINKIMSVKELELENASVFSTSR